MSTTEFHYTTYIKSTPERVWAAITTPEFARQYWGNANFSDWRMGSRWEHRTPTGEVVIAGIVRESIPPTRLVLSWAAVEDQGDQGVTFAIEALKGLVRLHIAHDELEAGSAMAHGISGGWPRVLSSLKSLLETGVALELSCH